MLWVKFCCFGWNSLVLWMALRMVEVEAKESCGHGFRVVLGGCETQDGCR